MKKDLLLIKKAFGWFHVFPIAIILAAQLSAPEVLVSTLAIILFFVFNSLVAATFDSDFHCKWESAARWLPMSEKIVVASKYIMALLSALAALLLTIACEIAIVTFFNTPIVLSVIAVCAGFAFIQIYNAVVYPVVYRYGPSKMQAATVVCIALAFGIVLIAYCFVPDTIAAMLLANVWPICVGVLVVAALSLAISYAISLRVLRSAHAKQ